jgi:hypothetical protein
MDQKKIALSLLIALSGTSSKAQVPEENGIEKGRVYNQILKEIKNSGLSSSDVLEVLEAIQAEIPSKPNRIGPNDAYTEKM